MHVYIYIYTYTYILCSISFFILVALGTSSSLSLKQTYHVIGQFHVIIIFLQTLKISRLFVQRQIDYSFPTQVLHPVTHRGIPTQVLHPVTHRVIPTQVLHPVTHRVIRDWNASKIGFPRCHFLPRQH